MRSITSVPITDTSLKARGFVEDSFLDGLTVDQDFFHIMGGREGAINTGTKTGEVGYAQKRMSRKLEDLLAFSDGSIRTVTGKIIQFLYGDDGLIRVKYMEDI